MVEKGKEETLHVWITPEPPGHSGLALPASDNCTTRKRVHREGRPVLLRLPGYRSIADAYLPRVLADVLEGKLGALGKRMGHLRFKLSVDQNLMGNILAADIEIDLDELRKARVRCVKEVKETNSEISFEDAVRYQKGAE